MEKFSGFCISGLAESFTFTLLTPKEYLIPCQPCMHGRREVLVQRPAGNNWRIRTVRQEPGDAAVQERRVCEMGLGPDLPGPLPERDRAGQDGGLLFGRAVRREWGPDLVYPRGYHQGSQIAGSIDF